MDKEQLREVLQSWCKLDNEINELQNQIKSRKNDKMNATKRLLEIMKTNAIDRFDLNGDMTIIYKQQKTKKSLTKKSILVLLKNYFLGDVTKVEDIERYLTDNTETNLKDVIVRSKK
jgi:Family of unknown function (DUF5760)